MKNKGFAYRCARLNSYVESYLLAKQTSHLLITGAALEYLFDTCYYPDVVALVSQHEFNWAVKSTAVLPELLSYIGLLQNHAIFTASHILKEGDIFACQCANQLTAAEYDDAIESAEKLLPLQFENMKMTELEALLEEFSIDTLALDSEGCKIPQGIKTINVINSLKQLVFNHTDCLNIVKLAEAAKEVKSAFDDVAQEIGKGNMEQAKLSASIFKTSDSLFIARDIIQLDKDKKQSKLPGCIYDVEICHPQYPVIYRSPYVVDCQNQMESMVFSGCFSELVERNAFQIICRCFKSSENIEADILPELKKEILQELLRALPKSFEETAETTINTLKLLISARAIDGTDRVFSRPIINISISAQVRHIVNDHAEVITLIFGRSFIETPQKFLELNGLKNESPSPFILQERLNMNVENSNVELSATNINEKLGSLRFGVENENNEIMLVKEEQEVLFEILPFSILLSIEYIGNVSLALHVNPSSSEFEEQQKMAINEISESDMFECQLLNKSIILRTNNIKLINKCFKNYITGMYYSISDGFSYYVVQIDCEKTSNFAEIEKWYLNNDDIVKNSNEEPTLLSEELDSYTIEQLELDVYNSDMASIFSHERREEGAQQEDKMLSKLEHHEREDLDINIVLLPMLLPDFPYFHLLEVAVKYYENLGYEVEKYLLLNEGQLFNLAECKHGQNAVYCMLVLPAFVQRLIYDYNARYYLFQFEEHPVLTVNCFTHIKAPYFTSLGITTNCCHYISDRKMPLQFSHDECSVIRTNGQIFFNKEMFDDKFDLLEVDEYPADISITAKLITILEEDLQVRDSVSARAMSLFLQSTSYAVDALREVSFQLRQYQNDYPHCSCLIEFSAVEIQIFANNEFTVDSHNGTNSFAALLVLFNEQVGAEQLKGLESAISALKCAVSNEFCIGKEKKSNVFSTKEEVQKYYENEPLPFGWVRDGRTYISWQGEFSEFRPDIASLQERYLREIK